MSGSDLQAELKKQRPFTTAEEEVSLNLLRTHDVIQAGFAGLFKRHGLSSPLYNVLRILRGAGEPLPCLEVAARLVTREPDITRLIDRLEQKGLVARSRTEHDRRVVLIAVTDAGRAILADLDQPLAELHKAQLGHLTPEEQAELNRLLVKARRPESRGAH
jgi:DNA-binding MarR family transcriptional regulator